MHSQWNMSNEEMVDAVIQLAQYVEEGKFCDNMAYVNSATYLQHFCSLTSLSQEDMQTKIVSGIDKTISAHPLNVLHELTSLYKEGFLFLYDYL